VRIYRTEDGGATWAQAARFLLSPRDLDFVDSQTGWLVGGIGDSCGAQTCPNAIMLTTDGGLQWNRVSTVSTKLMDVAASSPLDAWVVGGLCDGSAGCGAMLVKTNSGGQMWDTQTLPIVGRDFHLQRPSAGVGVVGGISAGGAVVARTIDGGKTWQVARPACAGSTLPVSFRGEEGWLLCTAPPGGGTSAATVLHSADAGKTWTEISQLDLATTAPTPTPSSAPAAAGAITFTSRTDGWIVLATGEVERSTDGGKTWTEAFSAPEALGQVAFADRQHGWILGAGTIWRTSDGGATWQPTPIRGATWPILPSPPSGGDVE
jgi:photosystem II stability/assembly factor-like uncharacterized protein